jgi:hypothetical protein
VDDGADVGPIDAHTECVGGDDCLGAAVGEGALGVFALGRLQARVIDTRAPALGLEPRALFFGRAPGRRIDDRRAPPPPGPAERFGKRRVDSPAALALVLDLDGAQGQIGTREPLHHLRRVRRQAEASKDLVAHHGRGGGGARKHAGGRQV